MEVHKSAERNSRQKASKNELGSSSAEIKSIRSEYESLLKLYDELNSKMQRNERKLSSIESQINENIEVRGQVTSFAFKLMEQSVKGVSTKCSELEKELVLIRSDKNLNASSSRIDSIESEIKSLGKCYSSIEDKVNKCMKGILC
jgi:chromosome segregation ATPase